MIQAHNFYQACYIDEGFFPLAQEQSAIILLDWDGREDLVISTRILETEDNCLQNSLEKVLRTAHQMNNGSGTKVLEANKSIAFKLLKMRNGMNWSINLNTSIYKAPTSLLKVVGDAAPRGIQKRLYIVWSMYLWNSIMMTNHPCAPRCQEKIKTGSAAQKKAKYRTWKNRNLVQSWKTEPRYGGSDQIRIET